MIPLEKTMFVNRSPQVVFDYLTDPANDVKWRGTAISAEWTSEGPPGVGSTIKQTDKFLGREFDTNVEITIWDPPNQLGQKTSGGAIPFEFKLNLVAEEGGTKLTMSGTAEPGGFFKLAEGVVGKQLQKQISDDFENLKVVLEKP